MRTYREQFDRETADRIERLIQRIKNLSYPTGPSRYYGLDLAACLGAGALAGGLIIVSALMELYVRGLVVRYTEDAQQGWAKQVETEGNLENMRNVGFKKLLDHLVAAELFDPKDAELATEIYTKVRIPAHHGLPTRLLDKPKDNFMSELIGVVVRSQPVSLREFENFIEFEALPTMEGIVDLLQRNQY